MVAAGPPGVAGRWRRALVAVTLAAAFAGAIAAAPQPARAAGARVHQLRIEGVINAFSADYIAGGIGRAETENADAVLITMDTPGGLDSAMRQIIQAILNTRLPVILYVSPQGARAASAGLFITQAADVVAMAPGTNIGSAHPVLIGADGSPTSAPTVEEQKVLNDSVAYIQGLANLHHRNVDWAADAVRNSANVPADQAVSLHVADLVSPDTPTLLRQLDGRQVQKGSQALTLKTADATITEDKLGLVTGLLHFIADPQIALLLLLAAVLAIGFEVIHPGAVIPGVVGTLAGVLALVALQTLPVSWAGIALMAFAALLFAIDVRAPTHGVLTGAGVISLAVGSLLVLGAAGPFLTPNPALAIVPALAVGVVLAFFVSRAIAARRRPVMTGSERLVGSEGEVREDLGPEGGWVMVDGALWQAQSLEPIPRGTRVRVRAIHGLRLEVETAANPV
ncbi:MAG: nodulation protein NfeD [Candidatus Dormiibacterota bacterium]